MQKIFIGRDDEQTLLETHFEARESRIVAIYGRRRIGKSSLVREFIKGKECLTFEGLEKASTKQQLEHFFNQLKKQTSDPLLTSPFKTWDAAFNFITERQLKSRSNKIVLFFDELQWMSVGRTRLISLIKYYWDQFWSQQHIVLILCGSISSFMINRVIRSKALYGRISSDICLQELTPKEATAILGNKLTYQEILDTLLCFGAVPKYLKEINTKKSFEQNLIQLCFSKHGFFYDEFEKIFYSQFKDHRLYERIICALAKGPLDYAGIVTQAKLASGGGLSRYIENLKRAQFISEIEPVVVHNSKQSTYYLTDPFLSFYLKFISPHRKIIEAGNGRQLLSKLKQENLDIYLGIAFEKFCLRQAKWLAHKMGFAEQFLYAAPLHVKGAHACQIDLVFERSDNVTVIAEIKYSRQQIPTKVISEMQHKVEILQKLTKSRIQKALISLEGPSEQLSDAEYFDYSIMGREFV